MARDYTSEELQQAVAKLVRTQVRRTYGVLANRRTDLSFGDIQDASAGVFINYPSAPYYVVALGRDVLREKGQTLEETLVDLVDTVQATGRRTRPVEGLSSLANARSALASLSSATAARDRSLTRIEDVPAYQRFEQSTARFLNDEGKGIRSAGEVVQTAEEARSRLAGLVTAMGEQYTEVLDRAQYLSVALEDFDNLDLGARLANYVISNAEGTIGGWYDELSALSPKERATKLREVVLDVLAARSTVKGFGSLNPSVSYLYFNGAGGPYASSDYPCVPAGLTASLGGPYTILDDTRLDLVVDGDTPISVDVPSSYVAAIEGFIVEPYNITTTPGSENNQLYLEVTGYPRLTVPLTAGTTRTAQQVADDVTAAITTEPLLAEPYGPQLYLRGEPVLITALGGAVASFARTLDLYLNPQPWSGVALGDWVHVTESTSGNEGWYQVTDVTGLPLGFEASKETGSPTSELGATAVADLNRAGRALRVTLLSAQRQAAVDGRWRLGAPIGDDLVVERAQTTLGLPYGATMYCEPTSTASCVTFINGNPAIAPAGVLRVQASSEFKAALTTSMRSEPTDATLVVFTDLEATCDITTAGINAVFENFSADPTGLGQVIVIRTTAQTGQVDNWGFITGNAGGVVQATMYAPIPATELAVGVELCPDLSTFTFPGALRIQNTPPSVNDGTYEVRGLDGTVTIIDYSLAPVAVVLSRPLIDHAAPGGLAAPFTGAFGYDHLRFESKSVLLDSAFEVLNTPAGVIFFTSLPLEVMGETSYFGLPSAPLQVEVGDYLELNDTPAQATMERFEVLEVNASPSVLKLNDILYVNMPSWSMVQDAPAPWGRVRKRRHDNYEQLQSGLEGWLAASLSNVERYLAGFRRLLNPILVNNNPTAAAIGDAVNYLYALQTHLGVLTELLVAYSARRVEQVDALLDTYLQQGARRAVDTLVQGRFSAFFGLDQDDVSYPGSVQKALRDVNVEDLPQNKMRRYKGGELIDSYEEPDFEFDTSDTDGVEEVSPPGDTYEHGGGSAI
jgi:hypothetical protein